MKVLSGVRVAPYVVREGSSGAADVVAQGFEVALEEKLADLLPDPPALKGKRMGMRQEVVMDGVTDWLSPSVGGRR